jgi:hypothetical protein
LPRNEQLELEAVCLTYIAYQRADGKSAQRRDAIHNVTSSEKDSNKRSGAATVTLRGSVNGRPFIVSRSIGATKTDSHTLRLWVDGEDVSKQSVRETQEELEHLLPVSVLADAVFHGQHLVRYVYLHLVACVQIMPEQHSKQQPGVNPACYYRDAEGGCSHCDTKNACNLICISIVSCIHPCI